MNSHVLIDTILRLKPYPSASQLNPSSHFEANAHEEPRIYTNKDTRDGESERELDKTNMKQDQCNKLEFNLNEWTDPVPEKSVRPYSNRNIE